MKIATLLEVYFMKIYSPYIDSGLGLGNFLHRHTHAAGSVETKERQTLVLLQAAIILDLKTTVYGRWGSGGDA
jgi:hypothetical protein